MDAKQKAFVFFCKKLYDWYSEHHKPEHNDLSVLKVLKLLFFVAAFRRNDGRDLLDIFDNFQAMPYGPVEMDIYGNFMKINTQSPLKISRVSMLLDEKVKYPKENSVDNRMINDSINEIKSQYPKLITYDAFKLVDITHKWDSWTITRNFAALKGQNTWPMKKSIIRKDKQFFE